MGFDLFVHRFRNGESASYPREIAEDIFDRDAKYPSEMQCVEYGDGRGEIYTGQDPAEYDGFMLAHFGGRTIYERVLEIAHLTQSLIFWPSTYILYGVTDPATLRHLPADLLADRPMIALVRTVDELWAAIAAEDDSCEDVTLVFPEI